MKNLEEEFDKTLYSKISKIYHTVYGGILPKDIIDNCAEWMFEFVKEELQEQRKEIVEEIKEFAEKHGYTEHRGFGETYQAINADDLLASLTKEEG